MADADYIRCHYSVTCETSDLAVLHCLRALSQYAEQSNVPKSLPWGGTGEKRWRSDGDRATFRFTDPEYREGFVSEAQRLLPTGSFKVVGRSDTDPASRQR